ncbi:MAG: GAF domain-containing protein, partial [Rhodospirillaceae bacterium]|nr:GAF domain-containing protein [Rhodospirillaceae bacterium]
MAAELKNIRITPSTELALVGRSGQVVAYRDSAKMTALQSDGSLRLVTIGELKMPALEAASNLLTGTKIRDQIELDGRKWQISTTRIEIQGNNSITMLIAIPEDELFAGARSIVESQLMIALVILLVAILVGWFGTRLLVKPINRLARETKAIAAFDFEKDVKVKTIVSEVGDLGRSLSRMKVTIRKFLDIGHALSAEREFRPLLDLVLRETIELVESDGGAIYLWHEDEGLLHPEIVRWHDDEMAGPDAHAKSLPLKGAGLLGEIAAALNEGRIALIERRLEHDELEALGLHELVEREQAIRMALIVVPLFNRKHQVLGALLLTKAIGVGHESWSVSNRLIELIRAVSGSAGVAIENKQLLQAQKDLM